MSKKTWIDSNESSLVLMITEIILTHTDFLCTRMPKLDVFIYSIQNEKRKYEQRIVTISSQLCG